VAPSAAVLLAVPRDRDGTRRACGPAPSPNLPIALRRESTAAPAYCACRAAVIPAARTTKRTKGVPMIRIQKRLAAAFAAVCLTVFTTTAIAQARPYTEGPIVNVSAIRTAYGMYDEYLKWLAGPWKQEQEAMKKAGLILNYEVLTVEARGENDPDIYLVITYKNWAALDGLAERTDPISKQVYGSLEASNKGAVDRGKMRRVLGSTTMQTLTLK
jgi:hypothetical protein